MGKTQGALPQGIGGEYLSRQGLEGQMTDDPAGTLNEKALARRVKDHVVGQRHEFFAVVHPGFEALAAQELRGLGIASPAVAGNGGVSFNGRLEDAWRVNLGAGTISRVLMRLCEFKATGFSEFRSKLATFPWELHLAGDVRVAFSVQAGRSRLWHEGKLEEEAARAIAERLAAYGRRARFNEKADAAPSGQTVFLRLDENRCQVSLDSSGELLYRRGHGKFVEGAPLRETLACGILRAAALERYHILIDPFCGSGTFALEAGAIFSGRPVNLDRSFGFQDWPSFKPSRFRHVKAELEQKFKERAPGGAHKIYCSDIDPKAVATAEYNVEHSGLTPLVEIDPADFFHLHPPAGDPAHVLLVMNPPYGARQEQGADIAALYRRIGDKVRRDYAGCGYGIIVPGLELEKALGLPHEKKILFHNGGIPVALLIHNA
jgi:putative N6-adenine-specific DNA methylase